MALGKLNVVSIMEATLLSHGHAHISNPLTAMTNAHRFCNTQPTTCFTLLRIQLTVTPVMPGNPSVTFMPNLSSSLTKALSLLPSHCFAFPGLPFFCPYLLQAPGATSCATRKQRFNQNADSHSSGHQNGSDHNACSLKSIHIFSANEVSLSNTLVIISLIPIIRLVRLMVSCLTFRSSFSLLILFLLFSRMPSSYSGLSWISESLRFSLSVGSSN